MTEPAAPEDSPGGATVRSLRARLITLSRAPLTRPVALGLVAATMVVATLVIGLGYAYKTKCIGPTYDTNGLSGPNLVERATGQVCYTDLQSLWSTRALFQHHFPYVHGVFNPLTKQLSGGTLEYPVLTGLIAWLTSLPAHTDGQFVAINAVILLVCGVVVAFLLTRLTGRRGWWWALAPPLALYGVYNFDLLAVLAEVGAMAAVVASARSPRPRRLLLWAGVLVGLGAALKFYPLLFVPPIALYIALGRKSTQPSITADDVTAAARPSRSGTGSWPLAVGFVAVSVGVFVVINVPFMIAGFAGWWASFQFQWSRDTDMSTNSIWYWASRGLDAQSATLDRVSTVATAVGLLSVVLVGLWRRRSLGEYPWLAVAGSMVAAYLLLNKVDSPQYSLWLLPFLVLLRVRAGWILAWFLIDALLIISFFKYQYLANIGSPSSVFDSIWEQMLMVGVWGRIGLLVVLTVLLLFARPAVLPWKADAPTAAPDPSVAGASGRRKQLPDPAKSPADAHLA